MLEFTAREKMRNKLAISVLCLGFATTAFAANIPWWERPTVCKLDPTKCYNVMGTGYDSELWDSDFGCWGMKIICPEALTTGEDYPTPMGRNEISKGTNLNKDFDLSILNGDCFGARKTKNNGAMASVDGKYVRVWCNGILDNPDEYLENGEITFGTEPTCADLADYGYVATENGKCYGKFYDPAKYYIECNSNEITPSRIIVLNGADYSYSGGNNITDSSSAAKLFDSMEKTSASQREIYFKK